MASKYAIRNIYGGSLYFDTRTQMLCFAYAYLDMTLPRGFPVLIYRNGSRSPSQYGYCSYRKGVPILERIRDNGETIGYFRIHSNGAVTKVSGSSMDNPHPKHL